MAFVTPKPAGALLAIRQKTTASTDLYAPLHDYATKVYPSSSSSSSSSSSIDSDLHSVSKMRSNIQTPSPSPSYLSHLLSYYRALLAVLPRFPISQDVSHVNNLTFTWHDAFKPSKKASQRNLHFEMAAVMFNVGATYSQIALGEDRAEPEGLKAACGGFQSAAGAFRRLRDGIAGKARLGSGVTVDLTVQCAEMLESLMLAQAQECYFEKAVADNKAPGTCSKIAQQVSIFYSKTYRELHVPPLDQYFDKAWKCHLHVKSAYFIAQACCRVSQDLHEKENIGEEIARLKFGINIIADAKKSTKGVSHTLLHAISMLETNMNRNLAMALRENEQVYLMRVPEIGFLSTLPTVSLVKPTDLGEMLDAGTECLFSGLVPESSKKALSCYIKMVDDIICIQTEKLHQANENSKIKLKEMGFDNLTNSLDVNFEMPLDLKRDAEGMQAVGSGFEAELQQLKDMRKVDQKLLVEAEELLQKEEREDAQFREQYGTRWVRPLSTTLTKNLHDRLKKFSDDLSKAADGDSRIECSMKDSQEIMSILDYKPSESALQGHAGPSLYMDGNQDTIMGSLKESLSQLEVLGSKGMRLLDMINEIKRKDDILPKLMATCGSYEDLYKREISKYHPICEDLSENVKAQEDLLLQIQQAQKDKFLAASKVGDYKASIQKGYEQIATAIAKFREIKDNINEGLSFYAALQDALNEVKQICSDFVACRKMESQGMIEDLQRTIVDLNLLSD